jgi:transcriptional regulator with XRE-family HTH domain
MPSSSRPSPFSSVQVARQALADRLRESREGAELTSRELATAAGWHQTKISKLEHLVTSPSAEDIRVWCQLCGVPEQTEDLIASARAVNSAYMEWRRRQRTGLKQVQESYVPLWERTTRFRIYEPAVVPGLFQTGGYMTAVMQTIIAFNRIPDDLADAVQARLDRQRLIHEGSRTFAVLIEEQALRTRYGDAATMAGQLGRLLTVMTWPNVSLGIIPTGAERSGMWHLNGFWIYDSDRVITELLTAEVTVTQPGEVDVYARAFTALAQMAVYGEAARTLIVAALADLR